MGDHKQYVVQRGDTLWDIAERTLGDPLRYPEIVELSKQTVQPDGAMLTDAHWIYPGWVLTLPGDAGVSADAVTGG